MVLPRKAGSEMPPPPPRPRAGSLPGAAAAQAASAAVAAAAAPGPAPRDPALPLPLPWSAYFDAQQRVECPERSAAFNVYTAGSAGPVVLCLHGGGYTGLSWALIAARLKGRCRVVAPDLRGHGQTEAADETDLSAATLAADVAAAWRALFAGGVGGTEAAGEPEGPPPTVLVGHSMGGAVAVHAAALGAIPSLAGVVVIDVVEGTALASLPYMTTVLQKRPKSFTSLQQAVDWALDTGMCKRQEAAHISLPSMLVQQQQPLAPGTGSSSSTAAAATAAPLAAGVLEPLAEEETDEERTGSGGHAPEHFCGPPRASLQQQQQQQPSVAAVAGTGSSAVQGRGTAPATGLPAPALWTWRTNLEASAPYWEGWYVGLSDAFLALPVPKVLVLVGTDRLDRPLTIGQMQGKFQPVLLPQAGHAVHEDAPDRTADAIATFMKRFRIGEPPLEIPGPAGTPRVLPVPMGPAAQQH